MARAEKDPQRMKELAQMAEALRLGAEHPARISARPC